MFNKNNHKKDGLQTVCRECNKKRARQYYKENRGHHLEIIYAAKIKRIAENQKLLYNLLCESCCADCGESNPLVLEFDHNKDKKANISTLLKDGYSWKIIQTEIKKCKVRCSNCHSKKTHKERSSYRWQFFAGKRR